MAQAVVHIALVVRDYDEAIEFYTKKLHFELVEDTYQPEQDKRWVVISPPGSRATAILLARASKPEQEPFIGNQAGGRVFLFLGTDDFYRDFEDMKRLGIEFVREPKVQDYGIVAVFRDLYGNLWDLVQFNKGHPMSGRVGMGLNDPSRTAKDGRISTRQGGCMNNLYDDEQFFDRYAQMSRSRQGLSGAGEWRQFQAMFPDLGGKSVLDLGCGYGWHCKYAAECGAKQVLGIDLSENMIRAANEKNADPRITYRVCDVDAYEYPADAFDCVISNLVLHYIPDIEAVFSKVYLTLKAGGVFLLNMEHPVFTAGVNQDWAYGADGELQHWPVDNYFYPGERAALFLGQAVAKQHHTLTQILMGLIRCGFLLEAVEEATPSADMMGIPGMADEMRRPMMLLIRALKRGAR